MDSAVGSALNSKARL